MQQEWYAAIIKAGFEDELADIIENNASISCDLFLFCWDLPGFIEDMPYGTQKARTGDPYLWMENRIRAMWRSIPA